MRKLSLLFVVVCLGAMLPAAGALAGQAPASLTEWAASGSAIPQAQPALPAAPPAAAPEALTFYADRPTFDAAFPGLPLEDFEEGLVAPGGVIGCPHPVDVNGSAGCFDPGTILPGVAFWASQDEGGAEIALVGAGFAGNASKNIVANYFSDSFRITFDPPVAAAGMDLEAYLGQNTCTLNVLGASGLIGSTTAPCAELGLFWGVGSDEPIVEIDIIAPTSVAEGVDNIAFGTPTQQPGVWTPYGPKALAGALSSTAAPDVPVGWVMQPPSPIPHMDSAVVYTVMDGGLWVVGGLPGGPAQRYDPPTNTWWLGPPQPMPAVMEPNDACYGVDAQGHEVIILFPDTTGILVGALQVFDVTIKQWLYWPMPPGFPPQGLWSPDIVSTYYWDTPYRNKCYISGGATQGWPGGGNMSMLWQYDVATNTIVPLGTYNHIPGGFNWHVSWWVPWVGVWGGICVGGGVDWNLMLWPTTQCYDLAAGVFLPPNQPLGPLPLPLGGAADGWKYDSGLYQIWLMNGLDPALNHWNQSAWADVTTPAIIVGPPMAAPTYRTEGDDWNYNHAYAEGGSFLGWNPQPHNQFLVQQEMLGTSHVGRMKMRWAYAARPGWYKVVFLAQIHDQTHALLTGGTVSGDYTYPDGSVHSMTQTIAANGSVKFPIKTNLWGNYQFCVTGITIPGYPYNPNMDHTIPPCMSIQVGP
jgi:hypothetical protein